MRHRKFGVKLDMSPSHRKLLIVNMCKSFIQHEKLTTTATRCKILKRCFEKLITKAKTDTVHSRRLVYKEINNHKLVKKLFEEVAPRFKDRNGGYTRIVKFAGGRVGDGAQTAQLTLV